MEKPGAIGGGAPAGAVTEVLPQITLNKIALENMKPGTPRSVWGLKTDIGDANIQGFATDISTNVGGTVDFKIATDSTHYRLDIYRIGYYGGDGARLVDSIDQNLATAQVQPQPVVDTSLGLIDAGNWSVSASWKVPGDAVSGVYFAKLVREDGTQGENIIPFVVRDDSSTSNIVFQTSDTTWEAYNPWGGANLYGGDVPLNPNAMNAYMPPNCRCGQMTVGRAYAVSYNRPFITSTSPSFLASGPQDYLFGEEFPAIEWLEQNGYDVSYISGIDAARSGAQLLNHKVYMDAGHDEYWSGDQRANVEAARNAGVNLAFWSGNECYWKVQWNPSIDGTSTPYRTMTCYKETWANSDINPAQGSTATWRDTRFADPGQQPENALTGTMFQVDSWRSDTISIPYDMTKLRFWRNTSVANTQPGGTATLVNGLLGYEWNSDVDNGFRPAGEIDLSLSTIPVDTYLLDYGSSVGPADATHSLTMYRDQKSGALVFSAGTVMWSWGLNDQHDLPGVPTDPSVQQAMVNMFADMGVQPTTLDASLTLATQSTDHTAPVSTITSPSTGAQFVEGQEFTITGTAQDLGGGQVAGVEVSVDGGQTWHKAQGAANWSYVWIAQASGTYTIESRAADDSLNLETPAPGRQITVSLPSTASLWSYAAKPQNDTRIDGNPAEAGIRFTTTSNGLITGIRFYKGDFNIGTHTADLWSASGTLLATATFTGETQDGWQTATFSSPVSVTAGTTYVASYHTNGYYADDPDYFVRGSGHGPLTVSPGAGMFSYGGASTFPTQASNDNYWVDVVFQSNSGAPGNQAPTANNDLGFATGQNAALSIGCGSLTTNDTDPDGDHLTVSAVGNATHGTVSLNGKTNSILFTPDAGYSGPASFTYTVADGWGATAQATVSLTINQPGVGLSLFSETSTPATLSDSDPGSVELGMKFAASSPGTITGLRYYKSGQDTGTHVGSLWSATGTLLASATFTNETGSGWQTVTFAQPVSISAGQTYVASYHSNGHYADTSGYFASPYSNGPLSAPANAGVYAYGSGSIFPTGTYGATNYWVDVLYNENTTQSPPIANDDSGFATSENTPLAIGQALLLANDNDPDGDVLTVTGASGATHGTVSFDSQSKTITFTPDAGYTGTAGFSYSISDGRGGTASANVSLTVNAPGQNVSLFSPSDTPATLSDSDPGSVELGMKFAASSSGTITGLRYYKGTQDTGIHVGSLWSATGTLLASAIFTNETASGWQTITFAQPVSISAGQTYVASYHSNGHYADTPGYFAASHSNGPLSAPANAGVYAYGSGSLFPTSTYGATNYWVDVVYSGPMGVDTPPVAVNDSGFVTDENTPVTIGPALLLANDSDPDGDTLTVTGASGATHGSLAFDSQSGAITFTPDTGYTGTAGFSYSISDGRGGTASANVSLTVNTPSPPESLFSATDVPTTVTVGDPSSVELGMQFQSDVAGTITGFSFYKGPQNTGTHVAHLWSSTGTLLASATFTNETASGWQSVALAKPMSIQAGTSYVVSYHSNGDYSATGNYFTADRTNGDLTALASGNGVYAYGTDALFPASTYNKTNYYVDVAFKPQLAA